eukprot:GHUV01040674.1.p1 GENE.GHUV01040674.1~~GHUV01040674.1.p1  ORF type:complete len:112 (-),score=18.91 GHUV01040674.1:408-743(-)
MTPCCPHSPPACRMMHMPTQCVLQVGNERGIVISAGGKYYLPQAVVLLRILRHYHRSTLPVELFWYGDEEMDATTLQVWWAASYWLAILLLGLFLWKVLPYILLGANEVCA